MRRHTQVLVIPDCLPLETTEVLTPTGWVFMSNWKGQKILTTTMSGELQFTDPTSFVNKGTQPVYQFVSGGKVLQTTANHRNLIRKRTHEGDTKSVFKTTEELLGKACSIPVAGFKVDGDREDPRFLKLLGMCLGDGTRDIDNWKLRIKRPRKLDYLDKLFSEEDMTRNINGDYVVYRLRADLTRKVDQWMSRTKQIEWSKWLSLDAPSMEAVLEGILEADGCRKKDRPNIAFHAIREEHTSLVQTLASCVGYKVSRLKPQDNSYSTFPSRNLLLGVCLSKTPTLTRHGKYQTETVGRAEVGCFSVPTGAFMVRQGGSVWLTGNCHIPHQSKDAYNLMLKVAKGLNEGKGPSHVVLLGDYADFWAVSSHDKESTAERYLKTEVDAVNIELDRLSATWPKAKYLFIQGNHEQRCERYLSKSAPELFGLVTCEELFRMDKRKNWEWVPYEPNQLVRVADSKLFARHEPLTGGVLPAHGTVMKAGCSVIYGHDHKSQQAQVVMANGDTHLGISVGWLGDQRKAAFKYVRGLFNWVLGFGIVTYDVSTGTFFVDAVRIIRNRKGYSCFANGRWYDI